MTMHPLCNEPNLQRCQPKLRLQASAWIDAHNFGPSPIGTAPPAGIRLRWNFPFLAGPVANRDGQPIRYFVERAGPLSSEDMYEFAPRVGHASRSPTPASMWRKLDRADQLTFRAIGNDCQGVDAVSFNVPANAPRGTVTLIDVNGSAQIIAEIEPGDDFHFEWAGLKLVCFSIDMGVREVIGFDPSALSDGIQFEFNAIAEIDAAVWTKLALDQAAERVTNAADAQFLSVTPPDWDEFTAIGRTIDDAFALGIDVPEGAVAGLSLVTATRFESAALIGCGFIDGEHASAVSLDNLIGPFLTRPDNEIYVYRVTALLRTQEGRSTTVQSDYAFTRTNLAEQMTPARHTIVSTPVARAELINAVRPGPTLQRPEKIADPSVRVTCTGQWELVSDLPAVACVATHPVADDSVITGKTFDDAGTFLTGLNSGPRLVRGNSLVERREHRFDIPYFDSDVGCEVEALDFWDRTLPSESASMIQPLIDYQGLAPSLQTATCHAPSALKGSEVDLTLEQMPSWTADLLATYAKAEIVLMMRDPTRTPAEAEVKIGPASPTSDGQWSAEIQSDLTQGELDLYVGGTLAVGPLQARVLGMGPIHKRVARCTFEVQTSCAGADLYDYSPGWLAAHLSEDRQAKRLWKPLAGTIALLATGAPARISISTDLPQLEASATLYFATQLEFSFEGKVYQSSISAPVPAPYMHPAPPSPTACFAVQQLASDFYGREMVRLKVSHCHPLESRYATRLAVAAGEVAPDTFRKDRSQGMFGTQISFDGTLFEVFSRLSTIVEGDRFTVGIANVRTADDRESLPALGSATLRRIE
jgi:hypothetical protein